MLLIDEWFGPNGDGELAQTFVAIVPPKDDAGDHALRVLDRDRSAMLPLAALETIMRRYGKPLEEGVVVDGPSLDAGCGRRLQTLRYRAMVDASSRDYLVWYAPGQEPVAALGRTVASALRYLIERAARPR